MATVRHLEGELRVSANKQQIELRFFNPNWVSLLSDGTCVKPRVQAWSSYSSTTIRRSYSMCGGPSNECKAMAVIQPPCSAWQEGPLSTNYNMLAGLFSLSTVP